MVIVLSGLEMDLFSPAILPYDFSALHGLRLNTPYLVITILFVAMVAFAASVRYAPIRASCT